jgi:putative oxidoreductase
VETTVSLPRQSPSRAGRIAGLYNHVADVLDWLQPLFLLITRLYVAKVFFSSGLLKVERWDSTLALFANEYHVPLLSPQVAALLGTAAELGLPVLLLFGIGTRAAALALFAFNIVAVISYPDLSDAGLKDHVLWGVLMLAIAFFGPGKLAVDRWLGVR